MTRVSRIAIVYAVTIVAVGAVAQQAQIVETTVDVQILAISDFHGALEPQSGGTGRIGSIDAGGIEYLAAHLARLKATNPNTVIVSAGDNIGGTPLLSSLSHDEASVEALNLAGLQVSALGNHDLDEGWWELYRIQKGGCHPVDGCQDGTPFAGAAFTYLAANVTLDPRRADPALLARAGVQGSDPRPLLPAYTVREVSGVRIGFIGLILKEAPEMIIPASTRGLIFGPEAESINEAARALRERGVRAVVVLIHQGAETAGSGINGCEGMSRGFVSLVDRMSDEVDVVVSGHTHLAYNCVIGGKVVTSAASNGRLITDIDLRIQRSDGEVLSKSARNVVVTRDVPKDPGQAALIAHYRPVVERVGTRVVGAITGDLTRIARGAGESALGDVIADALLEGTKKTSAGRADVAFWNPGGIRADLVASAGSAATPVTYAQLFSVLPFGNEIIVKSVTGDTILRFLEQQFGAERQRIMQVSSGFTYAYDPSRPRGERIVRSSVRINGAPLVPDQRYRVVTSNFLWGGGDDNTALGTATDPVTMGIDVDVVADYFSSHSPVEPGPQDRIRQVR